jgi:hypothetical protein
VQLLCYLALHVRSGLFVRWHQHLAPIPDTVAAIAGENAKNAILARDVKLTRLRVCQR